MSQSSNRHYKRAFIALLTIISISLPTSAFATNITIDPDTAIHPFHPEMLGVQIPEWMHDPHWNKKHINDVPGLKEAYQAAGISLIRYGGGLEANNIGWARSIQKERGGWPPLTWQPNRSEYHTNFASNIDTSQTYQYAYGTDTIDSICAFSRATGIQVMMQINVNLYDPAMWADMLHYANVENNCGLKYFEIGNELDLVWNQQGTDVSPTIYRQRLETYLEELKKVDPNVQVLAGVTATAHNGFFQGGAVNEFSEYLYESAKATSPSGYKADGLSWHWYSFCIYDFTPTRHPNVADVSKMYTTGQNSFWEFNGTRDWARHAPQSIDDLIIDVHSPGIIQGVTEHNFEACRHHYGTPEDPFPQDTNHLNAVRATDTLGRLAYNGLDYNIWYTGYGDSYESYPMLAATNLNPDIYIRPTFYPMVMYGNYFGDVMVQSESSDEANLSGWASTDSTDPGKLKLMITNISGSPINSTITVGNATISEGEYYVMSNSNPTSFSYEAGSSNHGTTINGTTLNYGSVQADINSLQGETLSGISGSTISQTFPAYSTTAIVLTGDFPTHTPPETQTNPTDPGPSGETNPTPTEPETNQDDPDQAPPAPTSAPVDTPTEAEISVCEPQYIEVTGSGLGHPEEVTNPFTLTLTEPETALEVLGQIAGRRFRSLEPNLATFVAGTETFEVSSRTDGTHSWSFEQSLPIAPEYTFSVDSIGDDLYKTPRAAILYTTRESNSQWTSVSGIAHAFVYGKDGLTTHVEEITIPPTQNSNDVYASIVVIDNDHADQPLEIAVTVADTTAIQTTNTSSDGRELNIFNLSLSDIPVGTSEVSIGLNSNQNGGESAALVGYAINYACEDTSETPFIEDGSNDGEAETNEQEDDAGNNETTESLIERILALIEQLQELLAQLLGSSN